MSKIDWKAGTIDENTPLSYRILDGILETVFSPFIPATLIIGASIYGGLYSFGAVGCNSTCRIEKDQSVGKIMKGNTPEVVEVLNSNFCESLNGIDDRSKSFYKETDAFQCTSKIESLLAKYLPKYSDNNEIAYGMPGKSFLGSVLFANNDIVVQLSEEIRDRGDDLEGKNLFVFHMQKDLSKRVEPQSILSGQNWHFSYDYKCGCDDKNKNATYEIFSPKPLSGTDGPAPTQNTPPQDKGVPIINLLPGSISTLNLHNSADSGKNMPENMVVNVHQGANLTVNAYPDAAATPLPAFNTAHTNACMTGEVMTLPPQAGTDNILALQSFGDKVLTYHATDRLKQVPAKGTPYMIAYENGKMTKAHKMGTVIDQQGNLVPESCPVR